MKLKKRKSTPSDHTAKLLSTNDTPASGIDPGQGTGSDRWDAILFACLLLFTFLSLCFPLLDFDFWWHLKTGEWILANGQVPYVDLYTYTDSDKPWIDLHWGFQVLVALLYRAGGIPLVTLTKALVITAAVAIAWLAGGDRLRGWQKGLIWLFPIICIAGRGNERPEMLTQLFLAVWLWVARRTDQNPRWIWYLPFLQLVWVNCHALFVLGLVVGFSYALDAVVRTGLKGQLGLSPRLSGPSFQSIWIVGGMVAATCFMNPYFEEGAFFPLVLYRKFSVEKDFYSKNIGEFRPPFDFLMQHGFTNLYLNAEMVAWLITAVSFVMLLGKQRQWSIFRLVLFAGYSHLAWQASRNTNVFALIAGFVACENFSDRAPTTVNGATASHNLIARRWNQFTTVGFALLCILVVSGAWNQIGEKNKPFRLGESSHWFIHDAAKFAAQPGFPERAFVSHIGQADVYAYHNGPGHRVFMDARLEVCTQQTFRRFNDTLEAMATGSPRWMSPYRDGELPVVILDSRSSRPSINGMLTSPVWRLVFADRTAAVFLPVNVAETLELPRVDPTPLIYPDGPPPPKK